MKAVGVTGGIGSGKTTICKIFKLLGAPIYNADSQAKLLMSDDQELIENIKDTFGRESYLNGNLNRDYLAERVFQDDQELQKLNQLVHPAIKIDFETWTRNQSFEYVIKEAALLIENESFKSLNALIVVHAPESDRVDRVLKRDPFRSREELNAILNKQTSDVVRKELADYLIDNSGNELVIPQVLALHKKFFEEASY